MSDPLIKGPYKISVILIILYYIFMITASLIARILFQSFTYYIFALINFCFVFGFLAFLWLFIVPKVLKLPGGQDSLQKYLEDISLDKSTFNPVSKIILISLAWSGLILLIGILIIFFSQNKLDVLMMLFKTPTIKNPTWLIFLFALIPGIWEEIAFRGVILSAFKKKYGENENFMLCFMNGLLFGMFHFGNFFLGASLIRTIIQVIFASVMGIYFSFLVLTLKKLFSAILTHYLLDIIFFLALNNL